MVSITPPEPAKPILSTRCKWLLGGACATTFVAGAWPAGDLIYMGSFDSPGAWWVLVLLTLAAWMTFILANGQDNLLERIEELQTQITEYGDEREANGTAVAFRMNTQNGARRLTPVE